MEKKLSLMDILAHAEEGDVVWTSTKDTAVPSFAQRAGVTVRTERLLAVHAGSRTVEEVTRITVTGKRDKPTAPVVEKPARSRAPVQATPEPTRSRKPVRTAVKR